MHPLWKRGLASWTSERTEPSQPAPRTERHHDVQPRRSSTPPSAFTCRPEAVQTYLDAGVGKRAVGVERSMHTTIKAWPDRLGLQSRLHLLLLPKQKRSSSSRTPPDGWTTRPSSASSSTTFTVKTRPKSRSPGTAVSPRCLACASSSASSSCSESTRPPVARSPTTCRPMARCSTTSGAASLQKTHFWSGSAWMARRTSTIFIARPRKASRASPTWWRARGSCSGTASRSAH